MIDVICSNCGEAISFTPTSASGDNGVWRHVDSGLVACSGESTCCARPGDLWGVAVRIPGPARIVGHVTTRHLPVYRQRVRVDYEDGRAHRWGFYNLDQLEEVPPSGALFTNPDSSEARFARQAIRTEVERLRSS
jgi:hypothetical protein